MSFAEAHRDLVSIVFGRGHGQVDLEREVLSYLHKFGKIWADRTVPKLNEEEHNKVEDWAAQCFDTLLFNLINPEQKKIIDAQFGLDWEWVSAAVTEAFTDENRREMMTKSTNIFRVLIKTLLKAGLITERSRQRYALWVDMEELDRESDEVAGQAVADQGIESLREINASRKTIGRALAEGRLTGGQGASPNATSRSRCRNDFETAQMSC